MLYDVKFLTNLSDKRVAAFGYYASYAGAAITPLDYPPYAKLPFSWATQVLIFGAFGRCGNGAVDLCTTAGIPSSSILKWDMAETAAGEPFSKFTPSDIFINCVYLAGTPDPVLVTFKSLSKSGGQLRVAYNVSCDPTELHLPVSIYTKTTAFPNPTVPVEIGGESLPLTMVSIDDLPSLVSTEACNVVSELSPHSLKVLNRRNEGVWVRAEKLFKQEVAELPMENR